MWQTTGVGIYQMSVVPDEWCIRWVYQTSCVSEDCCPKPMVHQMSVPKPVVCQRTVVPSQWCVRWVYQTSCVSGDCLSPSQWCIRWVYQNQLCVRGLLSQANGASDECTKPVVCQGTVVPSQWCIRWVYQTSCVSEDCCTKPMVHQMSVVCYNTDRTHLWKHTKHPIMLYHLPYPCTYPTYHETQICLWTFSCLWTVKPDVTSDVDLSGKLKITNDNETKNDDKCDNDKNNTWLCNFKSSQRDDLGIYSYVFGVKKSISGVITDRQTCVTSLSGVSH